MSRLVISTKGLDGWRSRLADPGKHWRRGFSAFEAAVAWESIAKTSSGIPPELLLLLRQHPELADAQLILGVAEHEVALPGGGHASQNDVWALVRVGARTLSLTVEAKAGEPFGELVSKWRPKTGSEGNSGKGARLKHLLALLELPESSVDGVRYQLLHRTASALVEAERVGASYAAMIVQAFRNPERDSHAAQFQDFVSFAASLGVIAEENCLLRVPGRKGVPLFIGWATCDPASDATVARFKSNLTQPRSPVVVGVDVGARSKGYHAVCLRDGKYASKMESKIASEIAQWCNEVGARVVAVDAPCRWSTNGRARPAEQALMASKVWCFSTPTLEGAKGHRSRHFDWMLAGAELFVELEKTHTLFAGRPSSDPICMETFPHAATCALAGEVVPARRKREIRRDLLSRAGISPIALTNMDYIDAALCALVAHLSSANKCKWYGDEASGYIVVPEAPLRG